MCIYIYCCHAPFLSLYFKNDLYSNLNHNLKEICLPCDCIVPKRRPMLCHDSSCSKSLLSAFAPSMKSFMNPQHSLFSLFSSFRKLSNPVIVPTHRARA